MLLVCVFWGSSVIRSFTVAYLLFSLLCNMSYTKTKSKPDNSKSKSLPPLNGHYKCKGLSGNFTDLVGFMLKSKPDIFAPCETDLDDDIYDSDFPTAWLLANPSQGYCARARACTCTHTHTHIVQKIFSHELICNFTTNDRRERVS